MPPTGQVNRRSSPFFYRSDKTVRSCAANTAGYMVRIVRFSSGGGLAQLGEHYVRNVGVGGSTPLPSTKYVGRFIDHFERYSILSTSEAHRSRQWVCHSRCVTLSGPPVPASASCFLCDLCDASPPPVRESPTVHTRRKQDGDQLLIQTTGCDVATSRQRSGRTSVRRVRSSQRPSAALSRISPVPGIRRRRNCPVILGQYTRVFASTGSTH